MEVERYQEVIGDATTVKDIPTSCMYDLSKDLELTPRQTLILEL